MQLCGHLCSLIAPGYTCKLCRFSAAVKALLKEKQSDLLCLSLPRQKMLRGPAHLPATARILQQFRKTISIINFQSLGVTVTFAVSQSVSGVILGKQHGFTRAGGPADQYMGSRLAAFPSHKELICWSPSRTLKTGTQPSPSFECLHRW